MEWNQIYNQDCLEGLKNIPSNSIDIVLADPPYNIGKNFGNYNDNLPLNEYLNWTSAWLKDCFRILKNTGTIYIYGYSEILAHISTQIEINKQRWLIWHYTNKNVPSLNFWQRSHESLIVAWKDKPFFNRDEVRVPYTATFLKNSAGKIRTGTKSRFGKNGKETVYNAHQKGALPRDVISISTLAGGSSLKERAIYCRTCNCFIDPKKRHEHIEHNLLLHPTQKPLDLCDKLIKAARPKTDNFKVVIPFVGSGSECVSTRMNNGNFIGFETNSDYVLLAEKRLEYIFKTNLSSDLQISFL